MKKILLSVFIAVFLLSACSNNLNVKPTTSGITTSKVYDTVDGKVELEKRSILLDKVDILVPKDFNVMSEEKVKLKYPIGKGPTLVFTNEEATINVAFSTTPDLASEYLIPEYLETFKNTYENIFPSAIWYSSGVEKINGKNIGKLEFLSPAAIDTKVYNLIFFTDLDGALLIVTVNAKEKQMNDWKPIAHEIMNSITIKK